MDYPIGLETKNDVEALKDNEKEICAVTENQTKGCITMGSRAAESIWSESLLPEA